ncbi:MAG: sigma 54-interacting transcriptional regulator [Saprospiraceae bacterium]|nr:sigma 54-interacting transcriptional regulator [Lewinella sp.]
MTPAYPVFDPTLKLLQEAFEALSDGILLVDEQGAIKLANTYLLRQLHYEGGSITQTLLFAVNPHLTLLNWKNRWKSLNSDAAIDEETEFMTSDDQLIPVRTKTRSFLLGEQQLALIVVDFLLSSRRFPDLLDVATESGNLCVWELDLSTQRLHLIGSGCTFLGLNCEDSDFDQDSMGQLFGDHISAKDLARLEDSVRNTVITGAPFELELIYNTISGDFDHLLITGKAVRSNDYTLKVIGALQKTFKGGTRDISFDKYLTKYTLENVSDLIFWVKEDGTFSYINQAVCDRLGYTRSELMKLNAIDIADNYSLETRARLWDELRSVKNKEGQFDLLTKTGDKVPVLASLSYIVLEGEEYLCSFSKDISHLNEANRQLRLSQFSIDNTKELILWTDKGGDIFYANRAFYQKTGFDKSELEPLNFFDVFSDPDDALTRKNWWEIVKDEENIEIEALLYRSDGTIFPVITSLNYIHFEEQEFGCIYIIDRSSKKRRDVQLFLSQNALDSAQDLIFWIDEDIKIRYKNEAVRKTLGYKKGELKGKDFKKVCPDIDLESIMNSEGKASFESIFYTKTGEAIPVEVNLSPAQFEGTDFRCMIVRNISVWKELASELRHKQAEIEDLSLRLKDENILLKSELAAKYNFNNIITKDPNYRKILGQIGQVAGSNATVLILGETGTGKELLARAIYSLSDRDEDPFVKINCAALPENLIESELFGHEKGAFTGAINQKKGRFELADGGTLFLDEVGELPLDLQAKLLRVLQEGEFERLGGTKTLKVDVRIIAATNRNLEEMVEKGTFREDLFYRLNVFPIINPPLRERKGDIPLLINHFAGKYGERMGKKVEKISQADVNMLQQYDFPGNIRELENIVERAMILAQNGVLDLKASIDLLRDPNSRSTKNKTEFPSFEEMQKQHIVDALKKCNMRITGPNGAARLLKLNDRTLMSKMRKLGIKKEDYL